ncbi:MAG: hypothetical protein IT537_18750 [Hyphomicrobiales bacterium]|nr:hypothetical protein [Hyphomicrobiales bacterium]
MEQELFRKGAADCLARARAAEDPRTKYALILMAQQLYEFANRRAVPAVGAGSGDVRAVVAPARRSLASEDSGRRAGAAMPMS